VAVGDRVGRVLPVPSVSSPAAAAEALDHRDGITPYINASIIMQLMTVVIPQLEEMAKKGGEEGRKTISRYTRCADDRARPGPSFRCRSP